MNVKKGVLATILALAAWLPANAQSDTQDVGLPKLNLPSQTKPAGISILELGDSDGLTFSVPARTKAVAIATQTIPARTVPARLSTFTQTAAPEEEGAELIRQRFANGEVQIERWVKEDGKGNIVNHGPFTEFAADGTLIASGNFHLGKREANWTKQITAEQAKQLLPTLDKAFTPPFTSQAEFRGGKLHGEWILTDSKGNIVFTWAMVDGQRHGTSAFFGPKGEITQSITYEKNVAHGPAKLTSENDAAADPQELVRGMILKRVDKWYPAKPGSKAAAVLQSQEWQLTSANYNVASHDWERDSVARPDALLGPPPLRHGLAVTFYSNGQRESEGNYEHGKRSGAFAWWYPNGQQKTVGEYRQDAEHSDWVWWHENGMKQAAGKFADGKKVNEWSVWNADGGLVKRTQGDPAQLADRDQANPTNVVR